MMFLRPGKHEKTLEIATPRRVLKKLEFPEPYIKFYKNYCLEKSKWNEIDENYVWKFFSGLFSAKELKMRVLRLSLFKPLDPGPLTPKAIELKSTNSTKESYNPIRP